MGISPPLVSPGRLATCSLEYLLLPAGHADLHLPDSALPQALAIGVPELGGIIIAVSIRPELPWYKSLDKPKWAPPGRD